MGLNHSFKIIFPVENRASIDQYLLQNAQEPANLTSGANGSTILLVEPDRFLRRYFRDFYHGVFSCRDRSIEQYMVDHRCRVGCFDYYVRQSNATEFSINFVCVTSDMSLMCNDSPSVRAWFVNLCQAGKANLGTYHCENYYFEVFWWDEKERTLRISEEIMEHPDDILNILSDFYPLAFDGWYNAIDQ